MKLYFKINRCPIISSQILAFFFHAYLETEKEKILEKEIKDLRESYEKQIKDLLREMLDKSNNTIADIVKQPKNNPKISWQQKKKNDHLNKRCLEKKNLSHNENLDLNHYKPSMFLHLMH